MPGLTLRASMTQKTGAEEHMEMPKRAWRA
jgi:hypothetical protein